MKRADCYKPWCGIDGKYCVDCAQSSGAERSEVLQGCPPSAGGSLDSLAVERSLPVAGSEASSKQPADELGSFVGQSEPSGTELLPCPFCGQQPVVKMAGRTNYWWVGCEIHLSVEPSGCGVCHSDYDRTRAIKKWNTRAGTKSVAPTALPPQGERDCPTNID